jgi:signal transduction histidine kinase
MGMEDHLNVLIVDDDAVDRLSIGRALRKSGLSVKQVEATTASEAREHLTSSSFDCIFLDYHLPDQDGLDLIRSLRAEGIKIPMIVLTGQGDEQVAVESMKAGANDYLSKSKLVGDRLSYVLKNAVRIYRAELETSIAYEKIQENNKLLLQQNEALKKQQQQIKVQNLELIKASRLKSQFLATMSHELRTPMNAIIGFCQVLLRESKGDINTHQRAMLDRILTNSKNLLLLVNDILDISKIEAGRLELKPEPCDLLQLVEATVSQLRCMADEKHLRIRVESNLSHSRAFNDSMRVRQILINLISNAIKFTDRGEIVVRLSEFGLNRIAIEVKDTGIGIAAANLDHIFELFQQIDQSISRQYGGTGLGLAITRSLAEMMGGRVTVQSELGRGATFRVDIPRYVESASSIMATHEA